MEEIKIKFTIENKDITISHKFTIENKDITISHNLAIDEKRTSEDEAQRAVHATVRAFFSFLNRKRVLKGSEQEQN